MNRKRMLVLLVVVGLLALMIWLQVREWRHFDWGKFWTGSKDIRWINIIYAVFIVYAADFLRAVRWKIFLRPSIPNASWKGLISPQYVGFAGIALLGRPGELIRPYLIAKRENSTLSEQMAIWLVERAFDTGAVTVIVVYDLFFVSYIREGYPDLRRFGLLLTVGFAALVLLVWAVWKHGRSVAAWVCRRLTPLSQELANKAEVRIRSLSTGLETFHSVFSVFECVIISLGIWILVAFAYREIVHAYPESTGLQGLDLPESVLLMGASVAGGIITLPLIGGGSQLATISVLASQFGTDPEIAVSCGVLCWLVTFMSVIPLGLALARHEHVSLRRLTSESQAAEHAVERGQDQRPGLAGGSP
jgi:hypothetical protein